MMSKKYVKIRVAGYLPRSAKVAAMLPTGLQDTWATETS